MNFPTDTLPSRDLCKKAISRYTQGGTTDYPLQGWNDFNNQFAIFNQIISLLHLKAIGLRQ